MIGRDDELAVGRAFLGAAEHRLAVLAIEGPAGVGKTTIWSSIAAEAADRGFAVLACRPAELEATFTLAAVRDMLERVAPDAFAALPGPQREAIASIVTATDPSRALSDHLVAAAVRSLVIAIAAERPVLLAIDDVQWLDASSAAVLGFVARRVAEARVGLLVARRTGRPSLLEVEQLDAATMSRVVVGPLSLAAMHHVIKTRTGRSLPRPVLARVHTAADGNPLFAIEIARVLLDRGLPAASEPLPVPPDMRSMLEERVASLPPATREVLLLAAASPRPTVAALTLASGAAADEAIQAAVEAGILVALPGDVLAFAHPLLADAVLARATPAQRRAAHERLAKGTQDDEEHARHLALAIDGPDAAVADALELAAEAADKRGAPASAAALLEMAVERTDPDDAAASVRRRLGLARAVVRAGDVERGDTLLRRLIDDQPPGPARAEARLVLVSVLGATGTLEATEAEALAAVADAEGDPRMLARALATIARIDPSTPEYATRAMAILESLDDPDPVALTHAYVALGTQAWVRGGPIPEDIVERALALEAVAPLPLVGDRFSSALATWLKYLDDFAGARVWLRRVLQAATDEGDETGLDFAYSHLPQLELWTGDWPASERAARQHLELAEAIGEEGQRRQAMYNLANVLAHQGREREVRPMLDEEVALARAHDDAWTLALLLPVRGLLEMSLGRWDRAVDALAEVQPLRERERVPGAGRHEPALVEALTVLGRLPEARAALESFGARAQPDGRGSALAGYHRARAVVAAADGRLDEAVSALDDALREHARAPIPFDRAWTMLVRGRVLRRRRERAAARAAFLEARDVFTELGAARFAETTRDELTRTGIRVASGELTETERRVAELAAAGMTNREVAAALFISPKTVDANLARAYRKLGIASRAELGAHMQRLQT